MHLTTFNRGGALCVIVEDDRIDAAVAVQFKDAFRKILADHPARVIVDMQNVAFLDSSGLGALVAVMKLLPPRKKLELAGPQDIVNKVLVLTRMDSVFVVHPSLEAALASGQDAA
jgi:anti-sigma B factor antagonist